MNAKDPEDLTLRISDILKQLNNKTLDLFNDKRVSKEGLEKILLLSNKIEKDIHKI